jgi:hypothetical protein
MKERPEKAADRAADGGQVTPPGHVAALVDLGPVASQAARSEIGTPSSSRIELCVALVSSGSRPAGVLGRVARRLAGQQHPARHQADHDGDDEQSPGHDADHGDHPSGRNRQSLAPAIRLLTRCAR